MNCSRQKISLFWRFPDFLGVGHLQGNCNQVILPPEDIGRLNRLLTQESTPVEETLAKSQGKNEAILDQKVKTKADATQRGYENIPLRKDAEAYSAREELLQIQNTYIDDRKTKEGSEMNFTKYFYGSQPLRSLAEIRKVILALEPETDGLLKEVLQ